MNRESVLSRVAELRAAHARERERLALAEGVAAAARKSIDVIEGGIQDCGYWLDRMALAEGDADSASAPEHNGVPAGAR